MRRWRMVSGVMIEKACCDADVSRRYAYHHVIMMMRRYEFVIADDDMVRSRADAVEAFVHRRRARGAAMRYAPRDTALRCRAMLKALCQYAAF